MVVESLRSGFIDLFNSVFKKGCVYYSIYTYNPNVRLSLIYDLCNVKLPMQMGNHTELLEKDGLYANLVGAQTDTLA